MTEQFETAGHNPVSGTVGQRLAAARHAAKLDLSDIAARTRIPQRHLEALEEGRYSDLPAITYCTGFTKAYARALGLDEVALARDIRNELSAIGGASTRESEYFEPVDPARVAPRGLVWTIVVIAAVLLAGYGVIRAGLLDGLGGRDPMAVAAGTSEFANEAENAQAAAPAAAPATPQQAAPLSGTVLLTATDEIWLRIYQPDGKRLLEKTMKAGESWQVPGDAVDPMILTGRPNVLRVTVGGREVAPLGPPERTISNVGVSAKALAARAATDAAAPAPGVQPANTIAQP
ncbi:helix-turn-helix domain-containing protein [Sphingomonas sp. C3-2]|uniref:helix-turn-helix domain-containing protein n=1 Tax=Sphingomonas sp. C3-2 TaxID=3062169 RepID=UPI00294B5215|nr:helix-turn-helix domain-containing protein [Sphingomonas sp. C3-2]WOK35415.1 helix-turn-helix domain-containing protein [Sphingomonas sp. C3-2]